MSYPKRLPQIERGSFYHPYKYSQRELQLREEEERKKREFTTSYYEHIHNADGSCTRVLHPYEDEV